MSHSLPPSAERNEIIIMYSIDDDKIHFRLYCTLHLFLPQHKVLIGKPRRAQRALPRSNWRLWDVDFVVDCEQKRSECSRVAAVVV